MRILLASAVALAPLMAATGAMAEVVISTTRTTPITTSNATGSGADTIRIASGGTVNVTSGANVTIDSNHIVNLEAGGTIGGTSAAPSGVTGILAQGGVTSGITIGGTITLQDDITTYPNPDNDGDLDGPFASGTDRYGVRITGPGAFTGNLIGGTSGAIVIEGNNSRGISVESDLIGKIQNQATVRVIGDNSTAIDISGDVTGQVTIGGTISALGENARGLDISGDISGRLTFQADLTTTGYRYTTRPTDTVLQGLDADDLLQAGPAVSISGNVGGGVVFDIAPIDSDTANPDEDNDGIPDATETNSAIVSIGGSPALQIGSTTQAITLAVVGTGDNAFGLINRNVINAQGVYDNIDTTAVRIGVDSGQTVTLDGGFRNEGTITSVAQNADATGVHFYDGSIADTVHNAGSILAATTTDGTDVVTGLQIDAGATVGTLANYGTIRGAAAGGTATTYGVRDLSGGLTTIQNYRIIDSFVAADSDGNNTGNATAIDVSVNTTGVTFLQDGVVSSTPLTSGDADGDGVLDTLEPSVLGAILFGSGDDVADIRNGLVAGDISFGAGADQLLISGGAVVQGAITDADGQLDISVTNGILSASQTSSTQISNLNVGGNGDLIFTLSPGSATAPGFDVSGTATFANGAGIGARFENLLQTPERFTVLRAGTLNFGNIDTSSLDENSPYLYVVTADANQALGEVYIDARRRTSGEMGMIAVEAQAYDAIYSALGRDNALRDAFLGQTGRDDFLNLYEQMLPEHSGGPLLSLASGVDAVTRALVGRNASAAPGETSAWVQEINFYADKDRTDTYGFRSEGFGVAGGVERGSGLGALGISVAFTSSDLEDPESEAEEVLSASLLELGLYWRAQGQRWTTWARAAGGYATFESTRRLVGAGLNLRNESDWSGFTISAAGGASYERDFGRFSVRPEVYAEYFSLNEDSHIETGGGNGFDLEIDDRKGHLFAATAAVNISMGLGDDSWVRPELRVGWRQNISVDPGETIARFTSGGPDFRLTPETIEGGGPILGFRVNVGNELGMLVISADAEMIDNYVRYMLLLRASFRF